jgi:hypothetical protein
MKKKYLPFFFLIRVFADPREEWREDVTKVVGKVMEGGVTLADPVTKSHPGVSEKFPKKGDICMTSFEWTSTGLSSDRRDRSTIGHAG